jgi:hypothetical protein
VSVALLDDRGLESLGEACGAPDRDFGRFPGLRVRNPLVSASHPDVFERMWGRAPPKMVASLHFDQLVSSSS